MSFAERVDDERIELEKKIHRLSEFIKTDAFQSLHWMDKNLLNAQLPAMQSYHAVLVARLQLWSELSPFRAT